MMRSRLLLEGVRFLWMASAALCLYLLLGPVLSMGAEIGAMKEHEFQRWLGSVLATGGVTVLLYAIWDACMRLQQLQSQQDRLEKALEALSHRMERLLPPRER